MKKTDNLSERVSAFIQFLNDLGRPVSLPHDKKRLAENIDKLIRNVGVDFGSLREILHKETALGRGVKTLNLSPYSIIIQALLNQELPKMEKYLTGRDREFKVFIPRELELPSSLQSVIVQNAILAGMFSSPET